MNVICFLYCCAAGDTKSRIIFANGAYALLDKREGSSNLADTIVYFGRPIERNNNIIKVCRHDFGMLGKQEACGQQRYAYSEFAEEVAKPLNVIVKEGFSPREHYLTNAQDSHGLTMSLEIGDVGLRSVSAFPDVAHHAATVALAMHAEQQDRKFRDDCFGRESVSCGLNVI
jgi:hypothetical protein